MYEDIDRIVESLNKVNTARMLLQVSLLHAHSTNTPIDFSCPSELFTELEHLEQCLLSLNDKVNEEIAKVKETM